MSGCLLCLHLDLGLKTGFEFKVEVVFVNRDPFDQPPDHPFIVIAAELKISEPRAYQLIARAKAIGKEYRKNNG